jgi:hypothetical protein
MVENFQYVWFETPRVLFSDGVFWMSVYIATSGKKAIVISIHLQTKENSEESVQERQGDIEPRPPEH